MITYTDEEIFERAKQYIKQNLKSGDDFSISMLQRGFSIGYNKAYRILNMLSDEKIIKLCPNRIKSPIVL